MKSQRLFFLSLLVASFHIFSGRLVANEEASSFPSPVEKIFVPNVFDDNDNVQIALQGVYSHSCLQNAKTGYSLDQENKLLKVWATSTNQAADHSEPSECIEERRPFIQVVDVGQVPDGEYTVQYVGNPILTRPLTITVHTSEYPDEHIYAPVDFVAVEDKEAYSFAADKSADRFSVDGTQITLIGTFPYLYVGCMQLKEVQIERNPSDVIIIRPIAQVTEDKCRRSNDNYKFEYTTPLPDGLEETTLLHVRLPDGGSLNKLLVNRPESF